MEELFIKAGELYLIENLPKCTKDQIGFFKRMYSHDNPERSIEEIVNSMTEKNLTTAIDQVRRTLIKNERLINEQ